MKKICPSTFYSPPEVKHEAECERKKGHKGKHRERWTQSDWKGEQRAVITVEWEDIED